jgi:hypothetical protein
MGAGGTGIFEDDTAIDFLYDLLEIEEPIPEMEAIFATIETDKYIEMDDGSATLVSAAILAHWHSEHQIDVDATTRFEEWLIEHKQPVSEVLRKRAVKALRRIEGNESELCELWADSDDYTEWRRGVKKIIVSLERP